MKRLLDAKEVAERLGYSVNTINRYFREGRIPKPKKVLGKKLWDEETIENWIKEKTKEVSGDGKLTG